MRNLEFHSFPSRGWEGGEGREERGGKRGDLTALPTSLQTSKKDCVIR